jgi:N-acetylglucosamine malate deacetylase 1
LDVVHIVEGELARTEASAVLSHYAHDLSRDHQVTAQAAMTAARPVAASAPSLFALEVRSSTDWTFASGALPFSPALWVGIDDEAWAAKLDCLGIYHDELRAWPHPRSVDGIDVLARYRGSQVGLDRAEAFVVIRAVEQ